MSPYRSQEQLDVLWDSLFANYSADVPPVLEDGAPLLVGVGINFMKFRQLDEVAGTMDVAVSLRLCWDDPRLAFDAQEFFGINWTHEGDKVTMPSDKLWTPDITILNEVGGLHNSRSVKPATATPLVLTDNNFRVRTGVNVLWSSPVDVQTICSAKMNDYPFDVQECDIVVGSWSYGNRQMLLRPQPYFLEEEGVHSREFTVDNIIVTPRQKLNKATRQTFDEVVYTVRLQRFAHFHVINFILPMISLTALTVATMWMTPGNAGVRVNASSLVLVCTISAIFITAPSRPAVHGDIWMDSFQSHCLALSFASTLQSVSVDYVTRVGGVSFLSTPLPIDSLDALSRFAICCTMIFVIFHDARQVNSHHPLTLYTSFQSRSGMAEVIFVYAVCFGLLVSSAGSVIWFFFLPREWRRKVTDGKEEDVPSPQTAQTLQLPVSSKGERRRGSRVERSTSGLSISDCPPLYDLEDVVMHEPMIVACRQSPLLTDDALGALPVQFAKAALGSLGCSGTGPDDEKLLVSQSADARPHGGARRLFEFAVSASASRLTCSAGADRVVRVVDGVVMIVPYGVNREHAPRLRVSDAGQPALPDSFVPAGRCVRAWPEEQRLEGDVCLLVPAQPGADALLRRSSAGPGPARWEELGNVTFWHGYAIVTVDRLGTFVPAASGLQKLLSATPAEPTSGPAAEVVLEGVKGRALELQVRCSPLLFPCSGAEGSGTRRWRTLAQLLQEQLCDAGCAVRCCKRSYEAWVEVKVETRTASLSASDDGGAHPEWGRAPGPLRPLAVFDGLQEAFQRGLRELLDGGAAPPTGPGRGGARAQTLGLVEFSVQEPLASSSGLRDPEATCEAAAPEAPQDAEPNPLALLHGSGSRMEFMPL